MLRSTPMMTLLAGLLAATIAGCAESGDDAADPAAPAASGSSASSAETEKGLAELSPEDRELAEQQKICPVTKQPLGSMGKPAKMEVNGRTVFVCCPPCIDEVKANPDEYLKNI